MKRLDNTFQWKRKIEIYSNSVPYTEGSNICFSGNESCKKMNHVLGEIGRKSFS